MKLLFFTFLLTFLFDLVSSQDELPFSNDSIKSDGLGDQRQLAIVPLEGRFQGYYLSVNDTSAILSFKSSKTGVASLHRLSTRDFPKEFRLDNAELRLLYLPAKELALLCTDSNDSVPQVSYSKCSPGRFEHLANAWFSLFSAS